MKILNKAVLTCLAIMFALIAGCAEKPPGFGEGTHLFVVADKPIWEELEGALRETFERTIHTPAPEKVFEVVWISPDRFNEFATRKNLALVGALDSDGEISAKVTNMLAPAVKEKVREGSAFFFPKENPWAEGQLLLVLASNTTEELAQKLRDNQEHLYGMLKERLREQTREQMYARMEQKELAGEILDKYGWTLRIQHDYFTNIDRADQNFYMLRRSLPGRERWLFVHWIEDAVPQTITKEWAVSKRDELTAKFYKTEDGVPDRVYEEQYLTFEEVDFNGRPALLMKGLWENPHESKGGGGPLRNYSFYDEPSGRIYMIDIAVFFPGGPKEPFLRQLDVMAHTFKTKHDIDKEQQEAES